MVVERATYFGELEDGAEDCPEGELECHCKPKSAFMLSTATEKDKPLHIEGITAVPIHKPKSPGAWAGETMFNDITFKDFSDKTQCGKSQRIFRNNKDASDITPRQMFNNIVFHNVEHDALAHIADPNELWATEHDCGDFPCTAPANVVLDFKNAEFTGES